MTAVSGIFSGLTAAMGLGGGFVLIIYLTAFAGLSSTQAAGVNLLFFLPIALMSVILHAKNKLIEWKLLPVFCIPGVIGAIVGVAISGEINESFMRKVFAVFLLTVGIKQFRR